MVAFNGLGGCGLFLYLGIFMVFMGYSNSQSSDILLRAAVGISQIFGGQDIPLSSQTMTYATAMALTAVTVFALAAIVAAAGKERKGHVFGAGI